MDDIINRYNDALATLSLANDYKEAAYFHKNVYKAHMKAYKTTKDKERLRLAESNLRDYWTYSTDYNKLINRRT